MKKFLTPPPPNENLWYPTATVAILFEIVFLLNKIKSKCIDLSMNFNIFHYFIRIIIRIKTIIKCICIAVHFIRNFHWVTKNVFLKIVNV
jgi:hypothetical protein